MTPEPPQIPDDLASTIASWEEQVLAGAPSWFHSRGLVADLGSWVRLAADVTSFWGFVDDYVNELGSRDRLALWMDRASGPAQRWLVGEVDRADENFRSNSALRAMDRLPDNLLVPDAWWRRRMPNDEALAAAFVTMHL